MALRAGLAVLTALLCSGVAGGDLRAQPGPTSRPTSTPAAAPSSAPTSAPSAAAATSRAQALTRAEDAFVSGALARAAALAATVEGNDRFAGRARFIEGYARYKLGELKRAAALLARSRALDPQPETTFLAGLVAFEQRAWSDALALLRPLAAAPAAGTWSASAAMLIARIERQRADARAHKSSRATQAAHARAIIQARAHLEAGQADAALAALKQADAASQPVSRTTLTRPPARRRLSIHTRLELGTGLDTNPAAQVAQVRAHSAPWRAPAPAERSLALGGRAGVTLRYALSAVQRGAVGLRLSELGQPAGAADLTQTAFDVWIRYTLDHPLLELRAGYGYSLALLDHAAFEGQHALNLEAAFPLGRPWLHLLAAPRLIQRDAHDEAYALLQGTELSGALALRVRRRSGWTLHAGWALLRTWAAPTDEEVSTRKDQGGNDVTTTFRADLTALGHGPRLRLLLRLPWRLTLRAALALSWINHDAPDRFVLLPLDVTIRAFERRDVRIAARAELSRPLGLGLELALAFGSEDNLSAPEPGSPVDWSYAQRTLMGRLRWRWDWPR